MATPPTHRFADPEFPPVLLGPLDPRWPFAVAAQYTVLVPLRELLLRRRAAWLGEDSEGVHKVRVAARRTRTALQTFEALWDPKEVERLKRYLSRFAKSMGEARELDVLLEFLRRELAGTSRKRAKAIRWMLPRILERRRACQSAVRESLERMDEDEFGYALIRCVSRSPVDLWSDAWKSRPRPSAAD